MHVAYDFKTVLKQAVHIESIAAYDNNVILGTTSGQLIMYTVDTTGIKDMTMFNKSFSKKPITQLEVVAVENLLFVLSDMMIQVCDISQTSNNFNIIHNSMATKGCSVFTLDVKMPKTTTGETATVIRLCCAVKRRLQFYYWKINALYSFNLDIELKDVPKAICFLDDVICVGYKDEYVIYNIADATVEKHQLIVTSPAQTIDPCICLLENNGMLGVVKDQDLIPINPKEFIKRNSMKSQSRGTFDVKELESKANLPPIQFSSTLLNSVWDDPYIIGRVSNGVEVRSLERCEMTKDTLVQTIPELAKIKFLVRSTQGIVFAAAISELWCLRAIDVPTQREQLLQQKKFQLAINLTRTSNEAEEVKAETIHLIRMNYAHVLFREKKFSAAMIEFSNASADPYDVIRLFPNLLPEQTKTNDSSSNASAASIPTPTMPQLEDKDLETAIEALTLYLTEARNKIKKVEKTTNSWKQLLSIIDTTLLKCYLINDGPVNSLVRMNQCHFGEAEKLLKKYNRISELVLLYEINNKHKDALQLLKTQICATENANYEKIIHYLKTLGEKHIKLICEFAGWVLTKNSTEGLQIFTDEEFIEIKNLPRYEVLDFLIRDHKALVIPYLEHVINVWNDTNTIRHNALVIQYREKVQKLMDELQDNKHTVEEEQEKRAELQNYRSKLYDLLKNSDKYSPDDVLKDFPTNLLLEERALILGRLRKHKKVLAIYVQVLGDIDKACAYCEEYYDDDHDIFITLLKTILHPLKQPPYDGVELHPDFLVPNQEIVLEIINKYAVKIDPNQLFTFLPDDMLLQRLSYYLDTVLRIQMAERHHMQITRGLLEAEIQRTKQLIKTHTSQFMELTDYTNCSECKKRFINQSAFVRYPNGDIVHLVCHDKKIAN